MPQEEDTTEATASWMEASLIEYKWKEASWTEFASEGLNVEVKVILKALQGLLLSTDTSKVIS